MSSLPLRCPQGWTEYTLLDAGQGRRLDRFGKLVLDRPEPRATGQAALDSAEWARLRTARFVEQGPQQGHWSPAGALPEAWTLSYPLGEARLRFELAPTAFKHVGLFPEQAVNWERLFQALHNQAPARVLNLFAYTGGASLAAAAAGAQVTHVDSVRQVLSWANRNRELSELAGLRWMREDAAAFAARERRRGRAYEAVILDPPSHGLGRGKRWKLARDLWPLLEDVLALLTPQRHLLILNLYGEGAAGEEVCTWLQKTGVRGHLEHFALGLQRQPDGEALETGEVVMLTNG